MSLVPDITWASFVSKPRRVRRLGGSNDQGEGGEREGENRGE